tara:strand:- start:661 stop:1311 length:651 start_codon:yes stop_codon:yes gene_type:complete
MLQILIRALSLCSPSLSAPPSSPVPAKSPSPGLRGLADSLSAVLAHLSEDQRAQSLRATPLPASILTVLGKAGIETVEQLCAYEGSLAGIPGLGPRRLKELIAMFDASSRNITLPDHDRLDGLMAQLSPEQRGIPFAYFDMSTRLSTILSNCLIVAPEDLIPSSTKDPARQMTPSAILLHTPNVGRHAVRELCSVVESMLTVTASIPAARTQGKSQ